jgi:hypothetical protein
MRVCVLTEKMNSHLHTHTYTHTYTHTHTHKQAFLSISGETLMRVCALTEKMNLHPRDLLSPTHTRAIVERLLLPDDEEDMEQG